MSQASITAHFTTEAARAPQAAADGPGGQRYLRLLGDHHDSVVARTVLLDLAQEARAAGEDTFTYGLMYQRQACQAAKIEQALA